MKKMLTGKRNNIPNLIVMLTHHDLTVEHAHAVFEECKNSKAQFWGFKEKPLPLEDMKKLYASMRACGKTTVLEVVEYTEAECLNGARMAAACGCDILMGTMFFDSVNDLCKKHKIKYMPFAGTITGRPSVLSGDVEEMIDYANSCLAKGADGFDLLGYRYVGDALELIEKFTDSVDAPVCVAGSVDKFDRLDELKAVSPWAFTIGSAFFENKFDGTFHEQVDKVCEYMCCETCIRH